MPESFGDLFADYVRVAPARHSNSGELAKMTPELTPRVRQLVANVIAHVLTSFFEEVILEVACDQAPLAIMANVGINEFDT